MKSIAARLFTSALSAALLSSALLAADYRYTKIDAPNATDARAFGINARGEVVGKYTDAGGVQHGYLLRKGIFSIVDFPNPQFTTSARAINARGDIVGIVRDANGNSHGFLLCGGQFTQIDYPGATSTLAFGINNSGDITGEYFTVSGKSRGFILRDGVFLNVPVPSGTNLGMHGAQDNGQVLVGDAGPNSDPSSRAFLRNKAGDVHQLLDPPGSPFPCSFARGINERGDVAGAFAVVNTLAECNSAPPTHGFILRRGEFAVIDFPGSPNTFVSGINDDGVIVGLFTDKPGNGHGFNAVPND
jgi:uncharacterized membrane protein